MSSTKVGNYKTSQVLQIGFVEDEEVLISFRRHWVYLLPTLMILVLGLFMVISFLSFSPEIISNSILTTDQILIISLVFLAVTLTIATRGYIAWVYNIYEITNKRIIVLKLRLGLKFKLQETIFELVKSAEQTRSGFFGNLLNYGHIRVSTDNIASNAIFKIRYVKNPEKIMSLIQTLIVKKD